MIIRCLWVLLGSLVLDGIAAFFMIVTLASAAEIAIMLIGLILMFWVGLQVGIAQPDDSEADMKVSLRPVLERFHRHAA